jgi:hypothetical protein
VDVTRPREQMKLFRVDDQLRRYPKRYYKLTRTGKAVLAADVSRMESVVRLARDKKLLPRTLE